ncbi:MAG: hypothetical protein AAFN93_12720, partial [Bacteroidota bacterium]
MDKKLNIIIYLILATVGLNSCYPDEELNVPVNDSDVELMSELDEFIERNFTERYGMAIRYRYEDRFVAPGIAR